VQARGVWQWLPLKFSAPFDADGAGMLICVAAGSLRLPKTLVIPLGAEGWWIRLSTFRLT